MLRKSTSNTAAAAALLFLCSAAAAAFFSRLPFDRVIGAAAAAFCLCAFTEINRILSPARSNLLVSGELTIAATAVMVIAVISSKTGPALPAVIFIFFSSFRIFKGNDSGDLLLEGILSLLIFFSIAAFLFLRGTIDANLLTSIGTGSFFTLKSIPSAAVAAAAALISVLLAPRISGRLSSVSSELSPAGTRISYRILTTLRAAAVFAAFIFSGAMIFPLELKDDGNRFCLRIRIFSFYLSVALISSAAASRGWGIPVLVFLFAASYVRYFTASRRSHARHQRSFIHGQRNPRS